MNVNIGFVMDPVESIKIKKDSTFAMMLEAQRRSWTIYYMLQKDLYLQNNTVSATMRELTVKEDETTWFEYKREITQELAALDIILMRKDPPFDIEYIYSTYLLELAESQGVLVLNKPQSLRDANEKMFTAWFPECCPPTLVTSSQSKIRQFLEEHGHIVVKPLGGMGGSMVFQLRASDPNVNVVAEVLTQKGATYAMAQRYIPDIAETGDKRVLLIDGEPVDYALARIPSGGDTRGNLAVGARGVVTELTDRDKWICRQVGAKLKAHGLIFVGLDIIGDYLTEINVTSPTGIREIYKQSGVNASQIFLEAVEKYAKEKRN